MTAIKTLIAAGGMSLFTFLPAAANEPSDPIRVLIDMAIHNAGVEPGGNAVYDDYFEANMLLNFFSQGFVEVYMAALLAHKRDREPMLLDHDPVLGGQDSCVPKDVVYGAPKTTNGVTEVLVGFKRDWCYDGEYEGKDGVTQVVYRLVSEEDEVGEPRFVIDDIAFPDRPSLRASIKGVTP